MKSNELLRNIFMTYNHSPGTQKSYVYALKQYCQYFGMALHEFLREAEDEKNKLKSELDRLRADIDNLKGMIGK
jgi:hypothetical protein